MISTQICSSTDQPQLPMANIMAATAGSDKPKRSFEYRMSKKVAELTQVVHMLFTRNHEKEVELEALREAYELEISEVIADARQRIAQLEKQQEEMLKQQAGDTERIRKLLEGEFQSKEQDWKKKMEENEKRLKEERTECQNLRDLLIRAQLDIQNLRQGVTDQLSSQTEEASKREREITDLKKQVQYLQQTLKDRDQDASQVIKDLEMVKDNLERELRHVHGALDESHKTRDELLMRNKQLEIDMKSLKRDLNRKGTDVVNGQRAHRNGSALSQNQNEELERLRREIQRYRLELSNRDLNFNRMFTDKQPIHVDRTGGVGSLKLQASSHSAGTVHPSMNGSSVINNSISSAKRERTLPGPLSGPVVCFQEPEPPSHHAPERQRAMSTPASHLEARDSRLPSIPPSPDKPRPHDAKPRLHDPKPRPLDNKPRTAHAGSRMSKPRPLPKEMLFGK